MTSTKRGHLTAIFTIIIWGSTFISTKILLESLPPVEILVLRFLLGFAALFAASPHRLRGTTRKQEATMALAGLCGICLYYLMENIALTCSYTANVGVIVSVSPMFTCILSRLIGQKKEKISGSFIVGFLLAMTGICLISFRGGEIKTAPVGDFLAVGAAFIWSCYSLLTKKISTYGYSTVQTTRRIFLYGILFMIPVTAYSASSFQPVNLRSWSVVLNLLFLGLCASALCFASWNYAVKVVGAVKTSIYIYLVPIITLFTAAIVLHDPITPTMLAGTLLTMAGLIVSEGLSLSYFSSAFVPVFAFLKNRK